MADNASYAEDNSLAKANAFVTACTIWLTSFAFVESKDLHSSMTMSPTLVMNLRDEARKWIASQPAAVRPVAGGNVVSLSVRNFRDEYDRGGPEGGFGGW